MVGLEDYTYLIPGEMSKKDKLEILRNGLSLLTPREIEILNFKLGLDGNSKKNVSKAQEYLGITAASCNSRYGDILNKIRSSLKQEYSEFDSLPCVTSDDPLTPYEILDKKEQFEFIQEALNSLPGRRGEVLSHVFGIFGNSKKTLEELSEEHGLSRSRVGQIKKSAFCRIVDLFEDFDSYSVPEIEDKDVVYYFPKFPSNFRGRLSFEGLKKMADLFKDFKLNGEKSPKENLSLVGFDKDISIRTKKSLKYISGENCQMMIDFAINHLPKTQKSMLTKFRQGMSSAEINSLSGKEYYLFINSLNKVSKEILNIKEYRKIVSFKERDFYSGLALKMNLCPVVLLNPEYQNKIDKAIDKIPSLTLKKIMTSYREGKSGSEIRSELEQLSLENKEYAIHSGYKVNPVIGNGVRLIAKYLKQNYSGGKK